MRSLLAASSLAQRGGPHPPAPSETLPPWAPGSQLRERGPAGTLWVPFSVERGGAGAPTRRPRPHRSSHAAALHTRVFHTLRMPGDPRAQAGASGHRALCSALTRGRGQAFCSSGHFGRRSGHPRVARIFHEMRTPRPYAPLAGACAPSRSALATTWGPGHPAEGPCDTFPRGVPRFLPWTSGCSWQTPPCLAALSSSVSGSPVLGSPPLGSVPTAGPSLPFSLITSPPPRVYTADKHLAPTTHGA